MKSLQLSSPSKKFFLWIITIILVLSFNSCAKKITFLTSTVVPAARGYVKVTKDNNKNYAIQIKLYNLAEVNRLQPSKETYIVWMVTDQDVTKNIGKVISSSSFFSRELTGSFETVSSFKPSKIIISAEESADVQMPGAKVVLSTDRF
ncbi:MAG: hypothetical protein WCJ03_08025 [Bacteroidales bacterium]